MFGSIYYRRVCPDRLRNDGSNSLVCVPSELADGASDLPAEPGCSWTTTWWLQEKLDSFRAHMLSSKRTRVITILRSYFYAKTDGKDHNDM